MGTDAEVFIFDYVTYSTAVVPAFSALLRGERPVDWLQPFIERRDLKPPLWNKQDLGRYSAALNRDLSCAGGPYDLSWTHASDWQEQWSNATKHSLRSEAPTADTVEQINWLFKIAVSSACISNESQFVGRSMTTNHYGPLLTELGVEEADRIVALLAYLGARGFLIGYQFGFGFEGVNGWLDPAETTELAERLDVLPLPRYEVSFAAMEQFRTPDTGNYECPGFSFKCLSLSFVRTTAAIAARQGRGLLWGNGLVPLINS